MQPEASHEQDVALLEHVLAELEAHKNISKQPAESKSRQENTASAPCCSQQPQPFDINIADEVQLRTIKGVGPVLAARIVKFRNKLGGFISQEQYQEVYGLRPEVVVCLKKGTYISSAFQPTPLKINTADAQTLAAHPYITYQQARGIVNYRVQHGSFVDLEALNALVLIDQATLKRLTPYLSTSP